MAGRSVDLRAASQARQDAVTAVVEAAAATLRRPGAGRAPAHPRDLRHAGDHGLPRRAAPGRLTEDLQTTGLDLLTALAASAGASGARPTAKTEPRRRHPGTCQSCRRPRRRHARVMPTASTRPGQRQQGPTRSGRRRQRAWWKRNSAPSTRPPAGPKPPTAACATSRRPWAKRRDGWRRSTGSRRGAPGAHRRTGRGGPAPATRRPRASANANASRGRWSARARRWKSCNRRGRRRP